MPKFRDMCLIAGVLQLTIGIGSAPPCILSGVISLAVALIVTVFSKVK